MIAPPEYIQGELVIFCLASKGTLLCIRYVPGTIQGHDHTLINLDKFIEICIVLNYIYSGSHVIAPPKYIQGEFGYILSDF